MCALACRSQMSKMDRATDPMSSFNVYLAQLMNEFFCNKGRSNVFCSWSSKIFLAYAGIPLWFSDKTINQSIFKKELIYSHIQWNSFAFSLCPLNYWKIITFPHSSFLLLPLDFIYVLCLINKKIIFSKPII